MWGHVSDCVCGAEIVALHRQRLKPETSRAPLILWKWEIPLKSIAKPVAANPEINVFISMMKIRHLVRTSGLTVLQYINPETSKHHILVFNRG